MLWTRWQRARMGQSTSGSGAESNLYLYYPESNETLCDGLCYCGSACAIVVHATPWEDFLQDLPI